MLFYFLVTLILNLQVLFVISDICMPSEDALRACRELGGFPNEFA